MSCSRFIRQDDPRLLERMDPGWWNPVYDLAMQESQLPLFLFHEFIVELTYGAIVTGRISESGSLKVIGQGQLAAGGLDLRQAQQVQPQSAWDIPRARIRPDDILMCRSGAGGIAKGRLTICLEEPEAVVGSFVNRIALQNIEPVWVMLALRSGFMQTQIHRIINGVGTPNISFKEIRSLLIPVPEQEIQAEAREQWVQRIIPWHKLWLAGNSAARHELDIAIRELHTWIEHMI